MNILTQSDPIVNHDYRPTHAPLPAHIAEARTQSRQAWQAVSEIVDARESYPDGESYWAALSLAEAQALAADEWAGDLYAWWQRGFVPEGVLESVAIDITVSI